MYLTPHKCREMLSDGYSRINHLWSPFGFQMRHPNWDACWFDDGVGFFNRVWKGDWCDRNWYHGNPGGIGDFWGGPDKDWVWPRFVEPAPALLGFDESIDSYCERGDWSQKGHAESCIYHNHNILSLYDGSYNTCRNLEWQVCAARGLLPGQGNRNIRFAFRPGLLVPEYIGSCTGYHPAGCGNEGYASYDIFYLEVCMFSTMCSNGDALFDLQVGQTWQCNLDHRRFIQLRDWVLGALRP